eukprot:7318549-Alexandrium_andersonii.AAC.1
MLTAPRNAAPVTFRIKKGPRCLAGHRHAPRSQDPLSAGQVGAAYRPGKIAARLTVLVRLLARSAVV